jgi:hypothetical protein
MTDTDRLQQEPKPRRKSYQCQRCQHTWVDEEHVCHSSCPMCGSNLINWHYLGIG